MAQHTFSTWTSVAFDVVQKSSDTWKFENPSEVTFETLYF